MQFNYYVFVCACASVCIYIYITVLYILVTILVTILYIYIYYITHKYTHTQKKFFLQNSKELSTPSIRVHNGRRGIINVKAGMCKAVLHLVSWYDMAVLCMKSEQLICTWCRGLRISALRVTASRGPSHNWDSSGNWEKSYSSLEVGIAVSRLSCPSG